MENYDTMIAEAVRFFWETRTSQGNTNQTESTNRGSVLGGRQMNGFLDILKTLAIEAGIKSEYIFTKGSIIPGFYRANKDWDMLITSPSHKLITLVELKSQIGSYGNNFNNRLEEAIGSSVDFWKAFRNNQFPNQQAPWVGYFMLVGKDEKSTRPVHNQRGQFPVLPEFDNASYLERYRILCQKMILERDYTSVALTWTSSANSFGDVSAEMSLAHFLLSFSSYLKGMAYEFQ